MGGGTNDTVLIRYRQPLENPARNTHVLYRSITCRINNITREVMKIDGERRGSDEDCWRTKGSDED